MLLLCDTSDLSEKGTFVGTFYCALFGINSSQNRIGLEVIAVEGVTEDLRWEGLDKKRQGLSSELEIGLLVRRFVKATFHEKMLITHFLTSVTNRTAVVCSAVNHANRYYERENSQHDGKRDETNSQTVVWQLRRGKDSRCDR